MQAVLLIDFDLDTYCDAMHMRAEKLQMSVLDQLFLFVAFIMQQRWC